MHTIDRGALEYVAHYADMVSAVAAPIKHGTPHFNTTRFYHKDGRKTSVCHIKPVYYENSRGEIRPLSEITEVHGNRNIVIRDWWKVSPRYLNWLEKRQQLLNGQLLIETGFGKYQSKWHPRLSIGNTVTTVFPNPDAETTSVDGSAQRSLGAGAGQTWTNIRAGAGNGFDDASAEDFLFLMTSDSGSGNWRRINRSFFLFDTSGIPDTDIISDATLSLFGTATVQDALSVTPSVNIYSSNPASNTSIAAADYSTFGTTAFSTAITYAGWNTAGYNAFLLNASGLAAITKTGVSKFGVRNANYDAPDSAPTWDANKTSYIAANFAEQAATTNDPKLVITHAAVASAVNYLALLGAGA